MRNPIASFLCLLILLGPFAVQAAPLTANQLRHFQEVLKQVRLDKYDAALGAAQRTGQPLIEDYVRWIWYRQSSIDSEPARLMRFIDDHRDWPEMERIQAQLERRVYQSTSPDRSALSWLIRHGVQTPYGQAALALNADISSTERIALAREAWRNGMNTPYDEQRLLERFGRQLTGEDHAARMNRLLDQGMLSAAERLASRLDPAHKRLLEARLALKRDSKGIDGILARVPAELANDEGLLLDRLLWRNKRGLADGVREILRIAPQEKRFPARWWTHQQRHAREALQRGQYSDALRLIANHGQMEGSEKSEALWLHGFALLKTGQPGKSYEKFYELYRFGTIDTSRSRAAYWAALAAGENGNPDIRQQWLELAAREPATFYGQLATAALGRKQLAFDDLPISPETSLPERFLKRPMVQLSAWLAQADEPRRALPFILREVELADSDEAKAYAGLFGQFAGVPYLSVRAGKQLFNEGKRWNLVAYPKISLPSAGVEPAFALAITRQESEFDPQAQSPVGATGLMQLMPATARETAGKHGMPYNGNKLTDPAYNLQLGSFYLARMITQFDGSYIKAAAAYNGGPGNVRKWERMLGEPGRSERARIEWIEMIPFAETRNYVQRVLANLQVYRLWTNPDQPLSLVDDLKR